MQRESESSKRKVKGRSSRMHVNEGPILMQQEQANDMTVRDRHKNRNPEIRVVSSAGLMAD